MQILFKPIITEKSMRMSGNGWYTFNVLPKSTKPQIADAVEKEFNVNVIEVRTILKKSTTKRSGRRRLETTTRSWKKALVRLKKDQKIALFETQTTGK